MPKAHIVTALLRDGNQVLLCHRSPAKRHYPGVWDLPGGQVDQGERPAAALARELHEELGIDIAEPLTPPARELHGTTFDMQIWLIEAWTGTPVNAEPAEHDAIAWFTEGALDHLPLAHDGFLAAFICEVLADGSASPAGVRRRAHAPGSRHCSASAGPPAPAQ